MAEKTFLIRMEPGPYRRELGAVVWDAGNNWTAEVDAPTAAELLTYPGGGYALATRPGPAAVKELAALMGVEPKNLVLPDESGAAPPPPAPERTVADVVGGRWATQLGGHGVTTVAGLAALDEAGVSALAEKSGASREEVAGWVKAAGQG